MPNRAWSGFELKEDIIPVNCVFLKQSKNSLREEFLRIRKEYEKVNAEINALQKQEKYNCSICTHSNSDKRYPDLLACWSERNIYKNNALPEKKLPTDHCPLWTLSERKLKTKTTMEAMP